MFIYNRKAEKQAVGLVPLLAMAMAVAFPMPLLAPVIMKARPAIDTSRSFSRNLLEADRKAFLQDMNIYSITFKSVTYSSAHI